VLWSMYSRRQYCSLECSAKDNRYQNKACTLCILPFTAMLSVGVFVSIVRRNPIDVGFLMIYGLLLLFQILMAYQVYIGGRP
jgi:hypothetical protein